MNIKNNIKFHKLVREIVLAYKDGNNEPLDGDAVDELIGKIKAYINKIEGNI